MKILDSDIIVSFLRGNKDAEYFFRKNKRARLTITVLTLYEVMLGAYSIKKHVNKTREFLMSFNILQLDTNSSLRASRINAELKSKGIDTRYMHADILIASIALENKARLVTRNIDDYSKIRGLKIERW
jgi:predicted nucleic acid-binding protein